MSGKYYATFLVKHTDNSDSYLRQAYRALTLHTDGTFVDEATDWQLMMKFAEENARGGESRLTHLDDWEDFDRFANDPLGARPIVYKAPGSKKVGEKVTHRTFFDNEYGRVISFIDQFACPQTIEEADRSKACIGLLRLVDEIRYCITPALAVEPGRIGLHAATQRTTHQLMHRQPEIPTFQVP